MYKLLNWIDPDRLNWQYVERLPNAIDYLEQNPHRIQWSSSLSSNPNAVHLLEKNPGKIEWTLLSANPNAIRLLKKNPEKINWIWLSGNPNAIRLLTKNPEKIDWPHLTSNPNAVHILEQNPDKIYWPDLPKNPNAIHLVEQYPEKIAKYPSMYCRYTTAIHLLERDPEKNIDWIELLRNPHPRAVELVLQNLKKIPVWELFSLNRNPEAMRFLEEHPRLINWSLLSYTPSAMHILEKYKDNVVYDLWLSSNPGIFELSFDFDRNFLHRRCNIYKEELIKKAMHPDRIAKYLEEGYELETLFDML
jgi:hypothetical protein